MRSYPAAQVPLVERPHAEPLYFAHLLMATETLYFSDRNFKFNGHSYEAYLLNVPTTAQSIEQFGGYANVDAQLSFRNERFRSYARLFDYFVDNPITKREMDFYVMYLDAGQIPVTDVSTKISRLSFGEAKRIQTDSFDVELFSILYALDDKKLFTQINRTNWPRCAPCDLGKYENRCIGSLKNVPCHCVDTGAVSTLAADTAAGAATVPLTDVVYPFPFPTSGKVQIGICIITYTGVNTTTNSLTGCTWSSPAIALTRGTAVFEVRLSYKYLVDSGSIKAVRNIQAAAVGMASSAYSISYNDGGKTTITFNSRAMIQNQGAHVHPGTLVQKLTPTGGTFTYSTNMANYGVGGNLVDGDAATFCHVGVTGATDGAKDAYFTVSFPGYTGVTPTRIYACFDCDSILGFLEGEYLATAYGQLGKQGYTTSRATHRMLIAGTAVPSSVQARAHTNQGTGSNPCNLIVNVYDIWIELEYDNIPTGGENAAWDFLAPQVTCDVDGYSDDGSGTYTGSPNALIANPSDQRRYILVALLGRSMSEIDTTFATARAAYAGRISGGYKFAAVLSKIGSKVSDIFKAMDEQSCSQMKEDGGKFVLNFVTPPSYVAGTTDILPPAAPGWVIAAWVDPYIPANACDDNPATYWQAGTSFISGSFLVYWGGPARRIYSISITPKKGGTCGGVKNFIFQGSNDNYSWVDLYTGYHDNSENRTVYSFFSPLPGAYKYHRISFSDAWRGGNAITEWEAFEATMAPAGAGGAVMDIGADKRIQDPVFSLTPSNQIKNLIRATYDLDYGNNGDSRKFGDYFDQVEDSDPASVAQYGELAEDIALSLVSNADMASDVIAYRLSQLSQPLPLVDLECNRKAIGLQRGDYITLSEICVAAWEGTSWRVLSVKETPDQQTVSIQAIQSA